MGNHGQLVPLKDVPKHRPWATERYVRRLIYERRIPYHKLAEGRGGRVLIDLADLDAYIAAHRVEPAGAA